MVCFVADQIGGLRPMTTTLKTIPPVGHSCGPNGFLGHLNQLYC